MRLIDADALVEKLNNNVAGKGELGVAVAEIFTKYIDSAPTIVVSKEVEENAKNEL